MARHSFIVMGMVTRAAPPHYTILCNSGLHSGEIRIKTDRKLSLEDRIWVLFPRDKGPHAAWWIAGRTISGRRFREYFPVEVVS